MYNHSVKDITSSLQALIAGVTGIKRVETHGSLFEQDLKMVRDRLPMVVIVWGDHKHMSKAGRYVRVKSTIGLRLFVYSDNNVNPQTQLLELVQKIEKAIMRNQTLMTKEGKSTCVACRPISASRPMLFPDMDKISNVDMFLDLQYEQSEV